MPTSQRVERQLPCRFGVQRPALAPAAAVHAAFTASGPASPAVSAAIVASIPATIAPTRVPSTFADVARLATARPPIFAALRPSTCVAPTIPTSRPASTVTQPDIAAVCTQSAGASAATGGSPVATVSTTPTSSATCTAARVTTAITTAIIATATIATAASTAPIKPSRAAGVARPATTSAVVASGEHAGHIHRETE